MFTSRFIIFALLSLLAGANACVQCPSSVKVNNSATELSKTLPDVSVTSCIYYVYTPNSNNEDSSVTCQYDTSNGKLSGGYKSCPATAPVKNQCWT
ncbi:uncharacterized protein EDB91DRAFT_1157866 [Suillus paluster]|uniref:uncharacterized protein n=1 Tax=Suillus paluster TaxID=48578 RepID=UPI001B8600BF|nr:uncharacterized protein EDB91DRAFT_1157866 [Suillus paluster]KAG1730112.1 hypothetical protein EDB91DRAFT_1157866 [Suillus paluster]